MLALEYSNEQAGADLVYDGPKLLAAGRDLETAILISLFTDAAALPGDVLPAGTPRRGYWADSIEGVVTGSRLWLLEGAEPTEATAKRAETYALEALQWLIQERHVRAIEVESEVKSEAIWLAIDVTLRDRSTQQLGPFQVGGVQP